MQVFTGDAHDRCHTLDTPGAYEWWYVDALSDDGAWGMVVILFRGMPMSPDYLAAMAAGSSPAPSDHCGFAVSVYHRGRRLLQAFRGVDAAATLFSSTECDVRVGPCSLRKTDEGRWSLHVDTIHPESPRRVVIDATLERVGRIASDDSAFTAAHAWVIAAPLARLSATMTIIDHGQTRSNVNWHGMAYHDHNMGHRAMQDDFRSWYWGRMLHGDRGFVYLATPDATQPFAFAAELDADGVHCWEDVDVIPSRHRRTYMGLSAARRIDICSPRGTIGVEQQRMLDDGPFYRRYLAMFVGPDGTMPGISEDMHVQRYRSSWIRPFLRTPWLRQ